MPTNEDSIRLATRYQVRNDCGQPDFERRSHTGIPPIELYSRSIATIGEIMADAPAGERERLPEIADMYARPLDSHDEIEWTIMPPHITGGFHGHTVSYGWGDDEWLAYEAAKMPAGYVASRLAREEIQRRRFASATDVRDRAIREALAEGESATVLAKRTGLTRARIYQIRDEV